MKEQKSAIVVTAIGVLILTGAAMILMGLAAVAPAKQAQEPTPGKGRGMNDRVDSLENARILPGTIIMWSGELGGEDNRHPVVDDITYWNWHVCDGTPPTPDLRQKFVMGADDNYPPNSEGGAASVKIRGENIPRHNHGLTDDLNGTSENGSHSHRIYIGDAKRLFSGAFEGNERTEYLAVSFDDWGVEIQSRSAGSHDHAIGGFTDYWGARPREPIETIPPYYALVFLMYVEPE